MTLTQILGCITNFYWFSNATTPTPWLSSLALRLYVKTSFWPIRHDLRNFDIFTTKYAVWPIPSPKACDEWSTLTLTIVTRRLRLTGWALLLLSFMWKPVSGRSDTISATSIFSPRNMQYDPFPHLNPVMNGQLRHSLLQPDDSNSLVKFGCSWAPSENWFQPDPA